MLGCLDCRSKRLFCISSEERIAIRRWHDGLMRSVPLFFASSNETTHTVGEKKREKKRVAEDGRTLLLKCATLPPNRARTPTKLREARHKCSLLNPIWKPNATFYVNFSRKPQISNEKGRRHNNYVPKSCGPRKGKKSLSLRKFRIRPPVLVPQKCWTPKEIGCSTQPISPYFFVKISLAGWPWTYIMSQIVCSLQSTKWRQSAMSSGIQRHQLGFCGSPKPQHTVRADTAEQGMATPIGENEKKNRAKEDTFFGGDLFDNRAKRSP